MLSNVTRWGAIRPLPATLRGVACSACSGLQASWWAAIPFEEEAKSNVCSLCLLYTSSVGKSDRESTDLVATEIEKARGVVFAKEEGRLTSAEDGDSVLGVVVLSSRVMAMKTQTQGEST